MTVMPVEAGFYVTSGFGPREVSSTMVRISAVMVVVVTTWFLLSGRVLCSTPGRLLVSASG